MLYVNTTGREGAVTLTEAVNRCVGRDGGLFMPQSLPFVPRAFFNNMGDMQLSDIAYVIATSFFGREIQAADLKRIVDDSFCFEAPMAEYDPGVFVLELFHGPTLTIKDYGARFMARLMTALDRGMPGRHHTVLVATTGNTGAAVANGFYGLDNVDVFVLYPKGKLSQVQTAQITSVGGNITPVEVAGSIEDCKRLIRQAIADTNFCREPLTGANSINIARLIPQITFSCYAYSRLVARGVRRADKAIYSVPAGNLSNLVATAMARKLGLPAGLILAATNENNCLRSLLKGESECGNNHPKRTFSTSIDITMPAGWPRLQYLYSGDLEAMRADIEVAPPVTDIQIAQTINELKRKYGYVIDPHGAVAYYAASARIADGVPRVVFATGHPAKLPDIMKNILGEALPVPPGIESMISTRRHPVIIAPTLPALKKLFVSKGIE